MDVLVLLAAGTATALATGLGALPVAWLGRRAADLRPLMWGLTIGLMGVASIVGLLLPAFDEGSVAEVLGGVAVGVAFLALTRHQLELREVGGAGLRGAGVRRAALVFIVLLVHSLPEGLAIGTAYASDTEGLSLFVILAIGLQNVPEGTSVAIPMDAAGYSTVRQYWAAVLTSAPQPLGAVGAFLLVDLIDPLLPISFGFAAGAMLAILAVEIVPEAFARGRRLQSAAGTLAGAALMLLLAAALGV